MDIPYDGIAEGLMEYVGVGDGLVDGLVDAANAVPWEPVFGLMSPVLDYFTRPATPVQINGNNGSATNTDDHSAPANVRPPQQLLKRLAKSNAKQYQTVKSSRAKNAAGGMKQVKAPVASIRGNRTGVPRFVRNNQDSMTISHSEMVDTVTGSGTFSARTYPMQPGLASSFPWLSTQCNGWEKYKWKRLTIRYETRTGTNVPGSVMLVADYDAADPPPTSEVAASTYHGTVDDAPWKEMRLSMNMARSTELFLRSGPLAANLDIKTYDFANLFVCSTDGTVVNWGKIFVDYEIELINAQVINALSNVGGTIASGGTLTTDVPFGTAPVTTPGSFVVGAVGNVITLNNLTIGSEYQIFISIYGTGLTAITTNLGGTINLKTNLCNDVGSATQMLDVMTVTASGNSGIITVSATGTTVTYARFTFAQLQNSTF